MKCVGSWHEYGIVLPTGVSKLSQRLGGEARSGTGQADASEPGTVRQAAWRNSSRLEAEVAYYDEKLEALATTHPECQRLLTIPGIGPITATALIAAVGDVGVFKNGRQFAAWLGLVPKQHSTGGQTRLLGISKRGDSYLRKLLIHGARATLRWARTKTDSRSQWIRGLLERRGWNRTAVAVANKNARIVWALLSRGGVYGESTN